MSVHVLQDCQRALARVQAPCFVHSSPSLHMCAHKKRTTALKRHTCIMVHRACCLCSRAGPPRVLWSLLVKWR